jgi:hypothetical protein
VKEKLIDLIYSVRSLCEIIRDRPEILDKEEEIVELLEDVEEQLDEWSSFDEEEEVLDD